MWMGLWSERRGPQREAEKRTPEEPADHVLGRSRGGFSTKVHIVCDNQGHALEVVVSGGQVHESQMLEPLLAKTEAGLTDEQGVLAAWPVALCGDRAYPARWIDELLGVWEIRPVIPGKLNERRERSPRFFDRVLYRCRNVVERLVGWLKENRRLCVRHEKLATHILSMIYLALLHRYLKVL